MASALIILCVACDETQHAEYATYSAAERAGAVKRGWVPAFVPLSATEIAEAHDLDINTQRLRFRAPMEDLQAMSSKLVPISLEEARSRAIKSPALSGDWPRELAPTSAALTRGGSLRLYRTRAAAEGSECLAIDSARKVVYAWSCVAPAT